MQNSGAPKSSWFSLFKAIFQPANLAKTVASQVPILSAGVEIMNQISGEAVNERIGNIERNVAAFAALRAAEASPTPPPFHDWAIPTSEYYERTVDLAVLFDGIEAQGKGERILTVAHACIIGPRQMLVCREALELVQSVAEVKQARISVIAGAAWYECEFEPMDDFSGLCIATLTTRDEEKWEYTAQRWHTLDIGEISDPANSGPVKFSATPWQGQEVGFLHTGEAENIQSIGSAFSHKQFETSVVSHFCKLREDAMKTFVSGVISGRILRPGSPVFARDGKLLGMISETENYKGDAGRRVVVRSLVPHPHFMKQLKIKRD